MCPSGDLLSPGAEYFELVKESVGHHFDSLASPDELVAFFGSLAEAAITACTSAPSRDGSYQGADVNSTLGLQLRMAYARYTAMPFEVSREGWAAGDGGGQVSTGRAGPQADGPRCRLASAIAAKRGGKSVLLWLEPCAASRGLRGLLPPP